jgi:ribosomal protein L37AE/L43A
MSDPRYGNYIKTTDKFILNLLQNMNTCPCCSSKLLRHIRQDRVYWFCSHCREEMPNLELEAIAISPQPVRKPKTLIGIAS